MRSEVQVLYRPPSNRTRRAGRAPLKPGTPESGRHRLEPAAATGGRGTTREWPENRSGIRPLARKRRARDPAVAKSGGTAGGRSGPLVPGGREGCSFSGRQTAMADQQRPGEASVISVADDDDLALEAPDRGSAEELLDAGAHAPLDSMRHSAAHVMAEAVLALFPGARLGIGPAITDGFYYDFEMPRALTPDDLAAIEARMRDSVKADHAFVRSEVGFDEGRAIEDAAGQAFKVEILDDLARKAVDTASPM